MQVQGFWKRKLRYIGTEITDAIKLDNKERAGNCIAVAKPQGPAWCPNYSADKRHSISHVFLLSISHVAYWNTVSPGVKYCKQSWMLFHLKDIKKGT